VDIVATKIEAGLVMLEARKISIRLGGEKVLDDVSLNVKPGEVLAVIGANGAGKSTLLKALSGEIPVDTGQIIMNGKSLSDWSLAERAETRAILPQNSTLSFPFSVQDVVLMGRNPHCKYKESGRDHQIVAKAIQAVEISHLQYRQYQTLSGGERQRVQFARILSQIWEPVTSQPRYLLLDEPTSALDLANQHETLVIARILGAKQGVGVLVILHDLNLAAFYADRIAILKKGSLIAEGTGTGQAVLTESAIEQEFGCPVVVIEHPQKRNCPLVISEFTRRLDIEAIFEI
jgi:iron complex transport system ATP-binding protein